MKRDTSKLIKMINSRGGAPVTDLCTLAEFMRRKDSTKEINETFSFWYSSLDYAKLLEEPLDEGMFNPDSLECLFEDCKNTVQRVSVTGVYWLSYFKCQGKRVEFTYNMPEKADFDIIIKEGYITTLGDLSRLTADKPLKLRHLIF